MKIYYQIFIIIFVFFTLYIVRDDVISVVGNISSHFNNINKDQIEKIKDNREVKLSGKIDLPGALRVAGDLLNINNNVVLSKDVVINLTNKARSENGNLAPLKENSKLDLSALKKLQDMFTNQYFEHTSPLGIGISSLGKEVGYDYILIGENLAMGNFKNDEALVSAWMASEGHKANILNIHYTEIGVAVGKGKFEGNDIWMAVQHFGTPTTVCPTIDQVLYGFIDISQNKLKEMSVDLASRLKNLNNGNVYEGSTYNEQIEKYNNLVNIYTNLVKETKLKIDNYNNQIRAFNLCIVRNE